MSRIRVDGGRGGVAGLGYGSSLTLLIVLAVAAPIAAGLSHRDVWLAPAAALSLLILFIAFKVAAPLREVARTLSRLAGGDEATVEPRRMLADLGRLTARVEELQSSVAFANPVTGLPTRERFLASVAPALAASQGSAVLGAVRLADYDKLAAFDPAAADRMLRAFSERLRVSVAASRLMGQVDRDSFAIWFPDAREVGELQALAYVLSQELVEGEAKITPQVALGAARFPADGETPQVLLTRALAALAEQGGAGKLAYFSQEAQADARASFAMVQELRRAVARNQFSLNYQPVVDLRQGRVVGAEALIRWTHPELGKVSPAEFVPVLEQSGMMSEVGLWVLNAACREARRWRDQGLEDLVVAVNLSTTQCHDPALPALVARTLERHGLAPGDLELELTETAAMQDQEATRRLLVELRALGVDVAIDDFGAGYSSLSYLKNLPFSKLKIDREFVTDIDSRRDSQAICSALVALSKGLDIRVLAEGVERREELEALRSLGCPLIQGYYFAPPLPAADFVGAVTDPQRLALLASPVHRQRALIDRRARA